MSRKIEMTNFGAVFNLHCPRCGNDEWSDEVFNVGKNIYHKCMHCGADICTDTYTKIGIVIEAKFIKFTPNTYDDIRGPSGIGSRDWKLPISRR